MAQANGIEVKKRYGQHFLRSQAVLHSMFQAVQLDDSSSVFEIGCGDGFLTREILNHPCARLWVFEIDEEWANYVKDRIKDPRLTIFIENILDADFTRFQEHKPWTLLANLPYQITFPILYLLQRNRALLKEGVVMVQEEVAQKIVKTSGRGYGFPSLFLQYYFELNMLEKVPPTVFYPPPKVFSRLLYFKPKSNPAPIPDESEFWRFIKVCFRLPRRTLKNNLLSTHIDLNKVPEQYLTLRAQQMTIDDFLQLWDLIRS